MAAGPGLLPHESGTFPQASLPSEDVAVYGNSWGRTPQAHGNVRWGGQNVCFPESSWVGALARQGLTAKAGPWLIAWAGGKAGVGAAGWCGARARGHFPRLLVEEEEDAH